MEKHDVLIIMGSKSDLPVMKAAREALESFGVSSRMKIASAHRTPGLLKNIVDESEKNGARVIIAGAGYAAHLAGAIAAHTTLPVIGVPLASSDLRGLDSLLSTVQMPAGIPVATMGIGESGAKNAAIFAVQILAAGDAALRQKLAVHREEMKKKIEKDNEALS